MEQDRISVEMRQWFEDVTLNVIFLMIAGKRYFVATETGDKDKAHRVQKTMKRLFDLAGHFVLADAIPLLGWLDVGGYVKSNEGDRDRDGQPLCRMVRGTS